MRKLKICVYAICKNESKFVDAWMDSMGEADLVVVMDTGSEDDTVERLRARGAIVSVEPVKPWRFDVARNRSLGRVPEDVDVCVCTDLDERFEPGWRARLESAWLAYKPQHRGAIAKSGRYLYNWSLKPDGTPDTQFYYFKAHERHGFRWRCPVHEVVQYIGALPLELVYIDGMVLSHYPDPVKSRASYLPLLELGVYEEPEDERMRYYLGREYFYRGDFARCVETLEAYLALPRATWREERGAAMRWIAQSCFKLDRPADAYRWHYRAVAEAPHLREPYVEFAQFCYARADWPMAYYLTIEALKITEKSKTYVNAGWAWDHTPHDLCAIASYRMGLLSEALTHARAALALAPQNERLLGNVSLLEAAQ